MLVSSSELVQDESKFFLKVVRLKITSQATWHSIYVAKS